MSIFDKLFGGNKSEPMPDVYWNYLEDVVELNAIEKESFEKPVAIFKHSITCGISKMAWNQFQKKYNISKDVIIGYQEYNICKRCYNRLSRIYHL